MLCLMSPAASLAHAVVVWAELIGDALLVEAYLSNGERATHGDVVVVDASGRTLLQGRLSASGELRVARPSGSKRLSIKVLLGPGHEGSFELSVERPPSNGSEGR